VSRREDVVVFFVEATLLVDFEVGFKAFLVAGSALVFALVVVALAGLAATLGSLISFFTVALFVVVSLASLVADFLVAEGFAALVAVDVDLVLVVVDFAGAFLVVVDLDVFEGLFWSVHQLCSATSSLRPYLLGADVIVLNSLWRELDAPGKAYTKRVRGHPMDGAAGIPLGR